MELRSCNVGYGLGSDFRPRKRKPHKFGLKYVDDMADVEGGDEDDDEEEEEENEHAYYQELSDEKGKSLDKREKLYKSEALSDDSEEADDKDGRQAHQHSQSAKSVERKREDMTICEKSSMLYMVKCLRGHELEAAVCLMQKFIDLKAVGKSIQILSAVALEHQKGSIYVEAYDQSCVKQACRGLQMLKSFHTKVIPNSERADALSVVTSVPIHRYKWVRPKMGVYKGDLGKVVDVNFVKKRITIKLIPRINLQELCARMLKKESCKASRMKNRPSQQFISMDEVENMEIPVKCKQNKTCGGYVKEFAGVQIQDGYHVKNFSLKSVEIQDITPTLDEFQKFQERGTGGTGISSETLLMHQSSTARVGFHFAEGETVLTGKPSSQKESLIYKEKEINKYFAVGEHVSVISGNHQGATGMIVAIEKNYVVIISDTSREDLRVLRDCIAESYDVASVIPKLGEYSLDDLVLLEKTMVGVILRVANESFQILKGNPDKVEVIILRQRDMIKRINDRRNAVQDANMKTINLSNMVRVTEGPHKGRRGRVEHIYGNLIFLRDSHYLENGGLLCVRANLCMTLGGFCSKKIEMSEQSMFLGNVHEVREGGRREEDELKGQIARIKHGPLKSYCGRVVHTKNTTVAIHVESQMRVVTVHRDKLLIVGEHSMIGETVACGVQLENQEPSFHRDNAWGDTNENDDNGGMEITPKENNGWVGGAAENNDNEWGNHPETQQDPWGNSSCCRENNESVDAVVSSKENVWGDSGAPNEDGWDGAAIFKNGYDNVNIEKTSSMGNNVALKGGDWVSNAAHKNATMGTAMEW